MTIRRMILAVAAAMFIILTGCAGTGDLKDLTKDYTFQANLGPVGIPADFSDIDESLRHWFTMPYYNPYNSN